HALAIFLGLIGKPPRARGARLVVIGEPCHQPLELRHVLDGLDPAIGVHDAVVPGPHRRMSGVPARRDVAVRPLEYHQRLMSPAEISKLRIAAGEMAPQRAMLSPLGIEEERDVTLVLPRAPSRDEDPEVMIPDEVDEHLPSRLGEMAGYVDH